MSKRQMAVFGWIILAAFVICLLYSLTTDFEIPPLVSGLVMILAGYTFGVQPKRNGNGSK